MKSLEKPPPALQRNYFFQISDQAMSTNVDFITTDTLDDLILNFSEKEVPVVPVVPLDPQKMNAARVKQAKAFKTDSHTLNSSEESPVIKSVENTVENSNKFEHEHEHEHKHKHGHAKVITNEHEHEYEHDTESIESYELDEYNKYHEEYDYDFNYKVESNQEYEELLFTKLEPFDDMMEDTLVVQNVKLISNESTGENVQKLILKLQIDGKKH